MFTFSICATMPLMSNSGGNDRQPKLWTPVFVVVIAVTFCSFMVGQGTNSGSTVYLDRLGETSTLAGIGATVFSVAAAVARIVSGPVADARGRQAVMLCGTAVLLVGVAGQAITGSVGLFLLWRLLQGIGFAAVTTAAATAAADVLPVERLGEGIGYSGLGQALAMAFGPALAITLVATEPPENLYWGLAVLALCAIAFSVFCRYEKRPENLPESSTYRRLASQDAGREPATGDGKRGILGSILEPGALAGGIPMMVISPALGFVIFFAGLLGTHMGIGNAGLFYTMTAASMIGVRLASKRFMDRVPAIKIHAVAAAGAVVAFALLIVVVTADLDPLARAGLYYFAGLPYGLCPGLAIPINQAVAVKNSSAERWGAANGLYLLLTDVGIGIAATIWGVTNDTFGFAFTMGCVIALVVASLGAAMLCYPAPDKRWRG